MDGARGCVVKYLLSTEECRRRTNCWGSSKSFLAEEG